MNPNDFWNLAGRAGRWGKEFQGNIVCVDARQDKVWKNGAPTGRTKFLIKRTADDVLLNQKDRLLEFIDAGTPREKATEDQNLEYVFSYLVSSYIRNDGIVAAPWAMRYPEKFVRILDEKINGIIETLMIPQEVILRNPGISPIAMENLLKYFDDWTVNQNEPIETLMPIDAASEDAVEEYTKILHRINEYLGNVFGGEKRRWQLALLIVDWMKGYPLARIISSRERYYGSVKLPKLIRDTMKDVEEYARFQAPKYLACYVDILRMHLIKNDRDDLVESLPELNVLLEFGVSQKTQLSLMGLGLSRSSVIAISEFITDDSLNESECLQWLKDNDWMTKDMPEIIKREVGNLLSSRQQVSTKE